MKKTLNFLSFILLPLSHVFADVIVKSELPYEQGSFEVKITSTETSEVLITIPQCIGGLGIKVEDGNKYDMKIDKKCKIDVPYNKINKKEK